MPATGSKSLGRLVAGFWVFNFILGALLLAAWVLSSKISIREFLISPTATLTTTQSPSVTLTSSPTLTPSLSSTPTATRTPTTTLTPAQTATQTPSPIPFSDGPIVIGYSVENRPLEVFRFGTGPIGRMIIAGMHGGSEYNTIQLADLLIAYLQAHPEIVPANVTLYILRDLNPDGEARAHSPAGRANANGVDLNRNWDANWQKDWPRDYCWILTPVNGGSAAMSEPETQALSAFIEGHPSINALINYHSAALGIFAGGLPPDNYSIRLAKAVAAVTTYPYPPINTGCDYTGGFTDWANERGIAALDVELADHVHTDYDMNLKALVILLNFKR